MPPPNTGSMTPQVYPIWWLRASLPKNCKVIKESIIVQLMENPTIQQRQKENCAVLFVLVFDREAYQPSYFNWLWVEHKIAVITYRKNVKNQWPENEFNSTDCQVINSSVTMKLCEKKVEAAGAKKTSLDTSYTTLILIKCGNTAHRSWPTAIKS